jgi:hypothetical protein
MSAGMPHPLTVAELLDQGWDVIRLRFWTLFLLVLPAQVLSELLPEPGGEEVAPLLIIGVVMVLVLYCMGMGGGAFVVEGELSGARVPWSNGWRRGLAAAPRVLLANLLVILGIVLLTLLLIVPGIWFAVRVALAPVVAALEGRGPSAMGRSQELVRGRWWHAAGMLSPVVLVLAPLAILDLLLPEDAWTRWLLVLGNTVVGTVAVTLPVVLYHHYARSSVTGPVAPPVPEPGAAAAAAMSAWPDPTPSRSEPGPPRA